MNAMAQPGTITSKNIETYMQINQGIYQTIQDVLTYNQVITSLNENIAYTRQQAKMITSNQLHL